jgi:hypothetical protein
MQRMVILICALILILDLADDGRLGKGMFTVPHSPVKSLEVYSDNHGAAESACQDALLRANFQFTSHQSSGQTITPVIQPICKILFSSHLSSAGGLPG